jgi:hypothetical protein
MTFELAAFILLLMGFDGGEMVRHYLIICDQLHNCVYRKIWSAEITNHVVE